MYDEQGSLEVCQIHPCKVVFKKNVKHTLQVSRGPWNPLYKHEVSETHCTKTRSMKATVQTRGQWKPLYKHEVSETHCTNTRSVKPTVQTRGLWNQLYKHKVRETHCTNTRSVKPPVQTRGQWNPLYKHKVSETHCTTTTRSVQPTDHVQPLHHRQVDWVAQLHLLVERVFLVVVHQLHQALELSIANLEQPPLQLDAAVLDLALRSAAKTRSSKPLVSMVFIVILSLNSVHTHTHTHTNTHTHTHMYTHKIFKMLGYMDFITCLTLKSAPRSLMKTFS